MLDLWAGRSETSPEIKFPLLSLVYAPKHMSVY